MKKPSKKTRSITIIGLLHTDRNGNTYNTATILVNGVMVHKTDRQYGYGCQYEEIAADWLEDNKYLPGREHHANGSKEQLWQYCGWHGIALYTQAIEVPKAGDL
jgi:hypothetical protein